MVREGQRQTTCRHDCRNTTSSTWPNARAESAVQDWDWVTSKKSWNRSVGRDLKDHLEVLSPRGGDNFH